VSAPRKRPCSRAFLLANTRAAALSDDQSSDNEVPAQKSLKQAKTKADPIEEDDAEDADDGEEPDE
jgi:hypothetical protein